MVSKLLKPNPNDRLGAGEPGSSNDMEALKSHPFFKGKSFKRCHKRIPDLKSLKTFYDTAQSLRTQGSMFSETTGRDEDDVTENGRNMEDINSPDSIRSMDFETDKKEKRPKPTKKDSGLKNRTFGKGEHLDEKVKRVDDVDMMRRTGQFGEGTSCTLK